MMITATKLTRKLSVKQFVDVSLQSSVTVPAITLGVQATAATLAPAGLGQVLIYPYYTVHANPTGVYSTLVEIATAGMEHTCTRC